MRTKTFLPFLLLLSVQIIITKQMAAQQFSVLTQQFISINADTLALTHVNIIDGTGQAPKNDQTLIIIKGRIAQIGKASNIAVTATSKVIDCSGKTIIPGMIMMHEHLFYGERVAPQYLGIEMPVSFPRLYLAGGVTTMRTTGSVEPQTDLNIRNDINNGKIPGPDIDVTGPYIERAGIPIPEILFIKSPEEAAKEVNYWISNGSTSFKVYMDITKADLEQVVKTAHEHNIKVTGHLCSITYREAADLGIDNLEHGFWVSSDFQKNKKEDQCNAQSQIASINSLDEKSPEMKELMAYLIKKNVTITSTLPVFEPYTDREIFPGDGGEALTPAVKEVIEKSYNAVVGKDSTNRAMFKKEMAWEKEFVDMGGKLMAGIDPTGAGRVIPGYADRHILELLVEAGFTLPQAVKICSMNAAEYLGKNKETGSIEVGKAADLVLINGDPQKDIKAVRNTEIVFKNGVGFDSKKLFDSVKGKVGLY
jgi:imidazolonepropionase-like amidohydrolase